MFKRTKNNWTKWHHLLHKRIINNDDFLPNGINLLISVSGGQDSMSLLTLINDIKEVHQWKVYVWHGDHRWHNNSQYYAKSIKSFCKKQNITFYSDYVLKDEKISTEETAREWRYRKLLNKAQEIKNQAKQQKDVYILTGHTSTDNAETFLINLARGSNFTGLKGIPNKRLLDNEFYIVRPILNLSREDTSSICKLLNIPIWEDPTNKDLKLSRNFIRYKVLDALEKIYPDCNKRINIFVQKMAKFDRERKDLSELALSSCKTNKGLQRESLNKLGKEARSTILNSFLKRNCAKQINSKTIDDLSEKIFKKNKGQHNLPGGINFLWNKNYIYIEN